MSQKSNCPCGSKNTYENCCGVYHDGKEFPPTAEKLMRSRYAAFVLHKADYLLQTWHPDKRPAQLDFEVPIKQWLGLKILLVEAGEANDATGIVKFEAKYKMGGRACKQVEKSRFEKIAGKWIYVDGE